MALGYGIISGNTDCVIQAGIEYEDEAERVARIYTEQYDVPFGYVELKSGFDFEMKNVRWITRSRFENWWTELKVNPYTNISEHKDLIIICCQDIEESPMGECYGDEIVCLLEKDECKKLAKELCGISKKDFNYWIQNEYTSDDSEGIIDTAIKNGKCVKIWK